MPLDEAVSVVYVKRVGGMPHGDGGPHEGESLIGAEDGDVAGCEDALSEREAHGELASERPQAEGANKVEGAGAGALSDRVGQLPPGEAEHASLESEV